MSSPSSPSSPTLGSFVYGGIMSNTPCLVCLYYQQNYYILNCDNNGQYFGDNVLNYTSTTDATTLSFPSINPIVSLTSLIPGASSSPVSISPITLSDSSNQNTNLSYDSTSNTPYLVRSNQSGNQNNATTFILKESSYDPWGAPYLLLSGAFYNLYASQSNVDIQITFKNANNVIVGPQSLSSVNLFFIPNTFYINSDSTVYLANMGSGSTTAAAYYIFNTTQGTPTQWGLTYPVMGWSTSSDAQNGVSYNYCSLGTYCSSQCRGPCSNVLDSCYYDSSSQSGGFTCEPDPFKVITSGWWKSKWFISMVIVISVVLLLLVILIAVLFERSKKKKKDNEDDDTGEDDDVIHL